MLRGAPGFRAHRHTRGLAHGAKNKNLKNVMSLHMGLAYGVLIINENLKPVYL